MADYNIQLLTTNKMMTKFQFQEKHYKPTLLQGVQRLKGIYTINQDRGTGLITMSWIAAEPEFTKTMLQIIVKELEYYLENEYESEAKREREFIENQLYKAEKELDYWERQVPSGKLILSKIQREQFASRIVYTELRKQLELAKIAEVKEIISFKVLDHPFMPKLRFKPNRSLIYVLTLIVSGFFAVFLLFGQQFIRNQERA